MAFAFDPIGGAPIDHFASGPRGLRENMFIPAFTRFIRASFKPKKARRGTPHLRDLQAIRVALMQTLEDCDGASFLRLTHKIHRAKSVQELWLLRNDAYQLISQQTSQAEAAARINALMTVFEGWVEPQLLVRIK